MCMATNYRLSCKLRVFCISCDGVPGVENDVQSRQLRITRSMGNLERISPGPRTPYPRQNGLSNNKAVQVMNAISRASGCAHIPPLDPSNWNRWRNRREQQQRPSLSSKLRDQCTFEHKQDLIALNSKDEVSNYVPRAMPFQRVELFQYGKPGWHQWLPGDAVPRVSHPEHE